MLKFTANDLRNLASVLAQFDKMAIPFRGETGFTTDARQVVTIAYHFDAELERHVTTFHING